MSKLNFEPKTVTSREKVSSDYENKQQSDIRNDIRELYRKSSFQIGKTLLLSDLVSAIDYTISTLVTEPLADEGGIVRVGIHTPDKISYPSEVEDVHKADIDNVYNVITLHKIESSNQLVDDIGGKKSLKTDIALLRATNNNVFLDKVDQILETDYKSPFIYGDPYIIKFKKDIPIKRANVNYNIKSGKRTMSFNTIKILPIPSIGNTLFSKFVIRKAGKAVTISDVNNSAFTIESINQLKRTMPMYMTFGETGCEQIYLSFDTYNYVYTMNASLIALGYISIEMVNYASKSYIGFEVDIPKGYSIFNGIEIASNEMNISPLNYSGWKLYDNWEDYDRMSGNFIVSSNHVLGNDGYRGLNVDKLYLLIELKESANNTSPIIRTITVNFSQES